MITMRNVLRKIIKNSSKFSLTGVFYFYCYSRNNLLYQILSKFASLKSFSIPNYMQICLPPPSGRVGVGLLFPSKVGRYFTPLLCFPLYNRCCNLMRLEPMFRASNDLMEFFSFCIADKSSLTTLFVYP